MSELFRNYGQSVAAIEVERQLHIMNCLNFQMK